MKKNSFKDIAEWLVHREFQKLQESALIDSFRRGAYFSESGNEAERLWLRLKEEEQYAINKYNEDNPDQHTKIEHLSSKEVVEKYKEYLSEEQLKEIRKYDNNI